MTVSVNVNNVSNENIPLTVALSTTGQNISGIENLIHSLDSQSLKKFELLIVLQSNNKDVISLVKGITEKNKNYCKRLIVSETSGLLKSRNIALAEAQGALILLADDDCTYFDQSLSAIVASAENHEEFDILVFRAESSSGLPLNPKHETKSVKSHTLKSIMHVCSIEIVFRRRLLDRIGTQLFDERFGLGTSFNTGGENIMLVDLYRRGIKIGSFPNIIVRHPIKASAQQRVFDLAYAKGAMFRRMFGVGGIIPLLAFFLIKHPKDICINLHTAFQGFLSAPTGKSNNME